MPVKIFFCYAHEDEALLNKLKTHLKPLQRKGLIDVWYDRDISAGAKWVKEIDKHLNEANIILLLVSPDFMDSDYCYGVEMQRALERDQQGEARVIPIILRPIYWQDVLGDLQALPTGAKPVMSSSWQYQDEALYNVTDGIRKVVTQLTVTPPLAPLAVEKLVLLRTLIGHNGGVFSVALSGDGQTLVSGSKDKTIKVWNLPTRQVRFLVGHTEPVFSVALSADGQTIVSGSYDQTIMIWGTKSI